MNTTASSWKNVFCQWPAGIPRRGVLVASYGEQISFAGFLTSETLLLLERGAPDSIGARMVVLSYENIVALKITDVVRAKTLESLGFSDSAVKK